MLHLVGDIAGKHGLCVSPSFLRDGTTLGNFEGTAWSADRSRPASKLGPHLATDIPPGMKSWVWSLANNHSADFGPAALMESFQALELGGNLVLGAGINQTSARQPGRITVDGASVAIFSVCERQYGGATKSSPGTAESGVWLYHEITKARKSADFVVVSTHAGPEDSPWPSPDLQQTYRSWVDAGADIVHGHHPHVAQGYEAWKSGYIFYSMGNFAVNEKDWATYHGGLRSWVASFDLSQQPLREPALHLVEWKNQKHTLLPENETRAHAGIVNTPLESFDLLQSLWDEISVRLFFTFGGPMLLQSLAPLGRRFSRGRAQTLGFERKSETLDKRKMSKIHHILSCPTHRLMSETALGILSGMAEDSRTSWSRAYVDVHALNFASSGMLPESWR